MLSGLVLASLALTATARPQAPPASQPIPETGANGTPFGIFGFDLNPTAMMGGAGTAPKGGTGPPSMAGGLLNGPETPKTFVMDDKTPGTGKYPAQRLQDGPTTSYTVYAPKTPPPADVKMPVLVYATCGGPGTQYTNLLTEIASHGYFVIAAGPPGPGTPAAPSSNPSPPPKPAGGMMPGFGDNVTPMKKAVDWVVEGKAARYGNIDTTKIATSGLSCGGLQALSTSYHDDRIKLTIVLHSGVVEDNKAYLLKEFKKYPLAYVIGGPKDIAYYNAERDWITIPQTIPAIKMNLDAGHIGTMFAPNAGKDGVAVVAILNTFFKNDAAAKALFLDKDSQLIKDNWNITTRNL